MPSRAGGSVLVKSTSAAAANGSLQDWFERGINVGILLAESLSADCLQFFPPEGYEPRDGAAWDDAFQKFLTLVKP